MTGTRPAVEDGGGVHPRQGRPGPARDGSPGDGAARSLRSPLSPRSPRSPRFGRRSWHPRAGDDDGQVLVLVIGAAVLAIAIAVTLAAVSGLLLERKRLVSVADNAAAFAAADVGADDIYVAIHEPGADGPVVTERGARDSVDEFLGARWDGEGGVEVVDVATDGTSVTVTLRTTVHPWLVGTFADVLGGEGVVVTGTGRARQTGMP